MIPDLSRKCLIGAVTLSLTLFGVSELLAQDVNPGRARVPAPKAEYSPYVDDHFPIRVFFGDTHLHSSWSTDVGMIGATLGPDVAYRVSRGEEVMSHLGWRVKLVRPLDFLVLADHAENLGLADFIRRSDPILLANETGKRWHDMSKAGDGYDAFLEWARAGSTDLINEPRMTESVWDRVVENAERYYEPGVFTTFVGFEWTSMPDGNNMHRVVVFRDGAGRSDQVLPYTQYDSPDAEDLWSYMAAYEEETGGRVLSIPHNGNLSNGFMFDVETLSGQPLTEAYARSALLEGLRLERRLGANPYKFGLVGSTDNHTALPTTRALDLRSGRGGFRSRCRA